MLGQERVTNITQPIESTRYELAVAVEFSVPPERVKRVLLAALKALSDAPGYDSGHEPAVLVKDTSSMGVEYLLRYWILPWQPHSPTTWRDLVLNSALRHLQVAGISLAYPKTDVYHARMPERQVEGHSAMDELKLLSKIPLFEPLETAELKHLVDTLHRRVFPAGQTLVRSGEAGDSLYVLIEGLLSVNVERDGQLQRVARLEPGQCFGEMSLLTGEPRSATIICVTESVVYQINRDSLRHLMEQRPELAGSLSRILAERQLLTHQALERHEELRDSEEFNGLARQLLGRMREFLGASRLYPVR
jgi:CRP-like cAMP-binding protein